MTEQHTLNLWVANGLKIREADTNFLVAIVHDGGHVVFGDVITPKQQRAHARLIAAIAEQRGLK